jgi:hypothetical protein
LSHRYPALTAQVGGNTAGATANISTGTIFFAGGNNITLSQNNNSVTISGAAGGAADGVNLIAAGSQTANSTGTVVFSNSNGISFGMSNSSVVTATCADVKSISAGTTRATNGEVVFSNSNGVSFGVNGNTVTAQMPQLTYFEPYQWLTGQNLQAGSVILQPISVPMQISATQADVMISINNAANQGLSIAMSFGLYTYSASTANSVSTASAGYSYNSTLGGASSATNYDSQRYYSINLGTWNLTPGQYLAAYWISTTTGQTAPTAISLFGRTAGTVNGYAGVAATTTNFFGVGHYRTTTAAMPAAIQVSDVQISGSVLRQCWFRMMGAN